MIPVIKPFLPPRAQYDYYLNLIWENNWLTNIGPLSEKLEAELEKELKVRRLLWVTNGTIALQMAIKAFDLEGEIITTPFSFVATTSTIVWENCTPVFVDIDRESLNIDAKKIEAAITPNTSAILATHVFGNPCDVIEIERIAKKHKLKVIYDGAHAFGVKVGGKSIFEYGDISICSLHATKLFHSIEGGLIFANDNAIFCKLKYMRNFGISDFYKYSELGINAKNSEFHAAMGLANLKYLPAISKKRKELVAKYDERLKGIDLKRPVWHADSEDNAAFYPVLFPSEEKLLRCEAELNKREVGSRRYFYPGLPAALPYITPQQPLPVCDKISKRVLCLPLYFDLSLEEVAFVCKIMKSAM